MDLPNNSDLMKELTTPDERNLSYQGWSVEGLQQFFSDRKRNLSKNVPTVVQERLNIAENVAIHGSFQYEFYTVSLFWSLTVIEMALKHKFMEVSNSPFQLQKKNQNISVPATVFDHLERYLRKRWKIIGMPEFNGSFYSLMRWAKQQNYLKQCEVLLHELRTVYQNKFNLYIVPQYLREKGLLPTEPLAQFDKEVGNALQALTKTDRDTLLQRFNDKEEILVEEIPSLRNELAHPGHFNMLLPPRCALEGFAQAVDIIDGLWTGVDIIMNWRVSREKDTREINKMIAFAKKKGKVVIAHSNSLKWPEPFQKGIYNNLFIYDSLAKKILYSAKILDCFRNNENKNLPLPSDFDTYDCVQYEDRKVCDGGKDIGTYFLVSDIKAENLNKMAFENIRPSKNGDIKSRVGGNANSFEYVRLKG